MSADSVATQRDDQEQLEFVGIEQVGDQPLARMRNLDVAASEWVADQSLLETRLASLIARQQPRGATLFALGQLLRHGMKKENPARYLGDGVYGSFDGYHIWLHVGSHDSPPLVALEPDVLVALNKFAADVRKA